MKNTELLDFIDELRIAHATSTSDATKHSLGQFFTPSELASFMASLFDRRGGERISLLDAGAGVGSLTGAFVEAFCLHGEPPESIAVYAFEIDPLVRPILLRTLTRCETVCKQRGVSFTYHVLESDFIGLASNAIQGQILGETELPRFTHAILNPPYAKLNSDSRARRILREVGIETSNLYTAFVWLSMLLLGDRGQLVGITPRSFCNGTYFRPFRAALFQTLSLERLHVFETRNQAFSDDSVLQENIIFKGTKQPQSLELIISSSDGPSADVYSRVVPFHQVVAPNDPERFVHLKVSSQDDQIASLINELPACLADLDLQVSTGKVVDFRSRDELRRAPSSETVPLVYPVHIENRQIRWPKLDSRKPNALMLSARSQNLIVPAGTYVLTKRFTSKEENRRLVAAICDSESLHSSHLAFENHLNYFHCQGHGLERNLAWGLWGYLNSSVLDQYFRAFSGHTQVNATDLRNLRYPSSEMLNALGEQIARRVPSLEELDTLCASTLYAVTSDFEAKHQQKASRSVRGPSLI